MRIGVLSDTHGRITRTRKAARMLESLQVEVVLHCGDIGSPEVVRLLAGLPVHFVLGNVDSPAPLEETIREAGQTYHNRFGSLELDGRRIAFLHGDDLRRLREAVESNRWDLVCHGHTHVAEVRTEGNTLVVNPGALHHTAQPTAAVVELSTLKAWLISV